MRAAARVAALVALWLLAWGEVSLANLLSGTIVAIALLGAFPPRRPADGDVQPHPGGIARLAVYVLSQLVRSNVLMTRQILRPPAPAQPGVLVHHLACPTDPVITLVSSIIALSPGTMTVDVAPDSTAIYVHFFHLDDVDEARRSIAHLEHLAIGAIGRRSPAPATPTKEDA